jgi:hypothetical protein
MRRLEVDVAEDRLPSKKRGSSNFLRHRLLSDLRKGGISEDGDFLLLKKNLHQYVIINTLARNVYINQYFRPKNNHLVHITWKYFFNCDTCAFPIITPVSGLAKLTVTGDVNLAILSVTDHK